MRGGCFCRPRYRIMLWLLVQVLTGCMALGQDSAQPPRDLADASLALAQNVRGRPGGGG